MPGRLLRWAREAWAEQVALLARAEELRIAQEADADGGVSEDAGVRDVAQPSVLRRVAAYWLPGCDARVTRRLVRECVEGLPVAWAAIPAAAASLGAAAASVYKLLAQGAMLDALASAGLAASGGGGGGAARVADASLLLSWGPGLAAMLALLLASTAEWLCRMAHDVFLARATAARKHASRTAYARSLLRQELAFHDAHSPTELAARLQRDSGAIDALLILGPSRLGQGIVALCTLAWMLWHDPLLTGLALALRLPQITQLTERSVRIAGAYERLANAAGASAQARIIDSLSNVRVVQAHCGEGGEVGGYAALSWDALTIVRASSLAAALLRHSEGIVLIVTEGVLYAFGALRILRGTATLGSYTSRRSLVGAFVHDFHALEDLYKIIRRAGVLSGRFFAMRDRAPAIASPLWGASVDEGGKEAVGSDDHGVSDATVGGGDGLRRRRGNGASAPRTTTTAPSSSVSRAAAAAAAAGRSGGASISFECVSFAYTPAVASGAPPCEAAGGGGEGAAAAPVLERVTLDIPAGAIVAFVGASGSGKTTAGRLLQRFYDTTSGRVRVDGVDVRDWDLDALRHAVISVDQDTALLNRSILENMCLGLRVVEEGGGAGGAVSARAAAVAVEEEALAAAEMRGGEDWGAVSTPPTASITREALVAAATRAGAHTFISALPGGYDATVGERGGRLSGGQRQRIALARLLLRVGGGGDRSARVAIVDEGTSALDSTSEVDVMSALLGGRARGGWGESVGVPAAGESGGGSGGDTPLTVILIAHRLATLAAADLVFVWEGGRIVESGTPAVLAARVDGAYARLLRAQGIVGGASGESHGSGGGGGVGAQPHRVAVVDAGE